MPGARPPGPAGSRRRDRRRGASRPATSAEDMHAPWRCRRVAAAVAWDRLNARAPEDGQAGFSDRLAADRQLETVELGSRRPRRLDQAQACADGRHQVRDGSGAELVGHPANQGERVRQRAWTGAGMGTPARRLPHRRTRGAQRYRGWRLPPTGSIWENHRTGVAPIPARRRTRMSAAPPGTSQTALTHFSPPRAARPTRWFAFVSRMKARSTTIDTAAPRPPPLRSAR